VSSVANAIAIAAGSFHSVALRSDGSVWTWGSNYYGMLGSGTTTDSYSPTQVISLTGVVAISAGYYHTLALKADGTVWAWGSNDRGELGNPAVPVWQNYQAGYSTVPVQVSGLTGIAAIAAGKDFSLAVDSNGSVWAWGHNANGELGNGSTSDSNVPVPVSGLNGVVAVAGGADHSMALRSDGSVWTWGSGGFGELGNGSMADSSVPVQVTGLAPATAIAAGYEHSAALLSDGKVWAWGDNGYSELGNGTTCPQLGYCGSPVPVQVSNLTTITAIAAGGADCIHTLAIRSDGTVWAWGTNDTGELGDGTTNPITVPVQTQGLTNVEAVAGAVEHSLALVGDPNTSLALSAASTGVAQTVAITGTSFAAHDAVRMYWDTTTTAPLTITVATANNTLLTQVRVPVTTAGRHNIIAVDQTNGKSAYAAVRVKPLLALAPNAGSAGSTTVVRGAGFSVGEPVRLYWDHPQQFVGVATTDTRGALYGSTEMTITVPLSTTAGAHFVFGVGQNSHAVGVGVFNVQ
jgi:alpha-tubulin suppressor-like RCC1 family protein